MVFVLMKMWFTIIILFLTLILYPSMGAPTQVTNTDFFQMAKEGKLKIPKLENAFKLNHTYDTMNDYFNYYISDENLFKMIFKQEYPTAHSDFHNYLKEQQLLIVDDVSKCKFKNSADILTQFSSVFGRLKDMKAEVNSKLTTGYFPNQIKNRLKKIFKADSKGIDPFSSSFAEAELAILSQWIKDWKFTENHPLMRKYTHQSISELEAFLKNELPKGKSCVSNSDTVEDAFIKFMLDFSLHHHDIMLKALDKSWQGTFVAQYFFMEFLNKNKRVLFEDVCECKLTPESESVTVFNNYQFAYAQNFLDVEEYKPNFKEYVRKLRYYKIDENKSFDRIYWMALIKTEMGKMLLVAEDSASYLAYGVQVPYIREDMILNLMEVLEKQGYDVETYNQVKNSRGVPILYVYADNVILLEARRLNLSSN